MKLEAGKISNTQLMLLVSCYIIGAITYISFADAFTKHDTWFVIIMAYLISIPFILSYTSLCKNFPNMNLIQINDIVYGSYLGKFISLQYIFHFFIILSLNFNSLSSFCVDFIMPETPEIAFLIFLGLVCAYAVKNGIECIARISFVILLIVISIALGTTLLQLKNMDFSNLLPIFDLPIKVLFQGIHILSSIIFLGHIIFLTIMPSINNYKHVNKYTLIGVTLSAFLLIIVSIRNTAVLGLTAAISLNDSYQSTRLIDIGNILTRMDILVALGITIILFMKSCILYYGTVLSISQLLKMRSYNPLILPIGIIAICMTTIVFKSGVEHNFHAKNYHAILVTPIQYIYPPITLLIAKIRKLPKTRI